MAQAIRAPIPDLRSPMLGILTLDTEFPRVRGDVGNPETFAFPVRHATVRGALVDDVVHRRRDALLPQFVKTANELVESGCIGIATTRLKWIGVSPGCGPLPCGSTTAEKNWASIPA